MGKKSLQIQQLNSKMLVVALIKKITQLKVSLKKQTVKFMNSGL